MIARLSKRSKITMVGGLSMSCLFLVLGIRQLGHPTKPVQAVAAPFPAALPPAMLPLATATRTIAIGETITGALIRTSPGDAAQNATIASPAEVIGKVATQPIAAGVPIRREMIGSETKLAIRVPIGMRAMSIDTTAEIAVAGLVRPGDRVDVQVVYPGEDTVNGVRGTGRSRTETLLQKVQILAVGDLVVGTPAVQAGDASAAAAAAAAQSVARTVTLALAPDQVAILSLAKNRGGLYLSLRNPTDEAVADVKPSVPSRPMGAPSAPHAVRKIVRTARAHPIELVVGGHSEILPTSGAAQ